MTAGIRPPHFAIVVSAVLALCAIAGATDSPDDRAREALNAYDAGIAALAQRQPQLANEHFRKAIEGFRALADAGYDNAAVEFNLGNAYARLRQWGRAIVHYRRAERLDPTDTALGGNLRHARQQVTPYVEPAASQQVIDRLLFWTHSTSISERFWIAALCSIAGWAGLAAWLFARRGVILLLAICVILLGVANGVTVIAQLHEWSTRPPAVVVAEPATLRQGRGEAYDPVLENALGPGVELRILEERGDWARVRLVNDLTGWLPLSAVERI